MRQASKRAMEMIEGQNGQAADKVVDKVQAASRAGQLCDESRSWAET